MKAMLLAAGLGTRLRPLTYHTPKPLIPVDGLPLIFYNLALLKKHGVREVVINLHHLGDQIRKQLGSGKRFGFKFYYSHEKEILGTGGGIKKAQALLKGGPFFVLNGDIITDCDLTRMLKGHQRQKPLATLVVGEGPLAKQFGGLYVASNKRIVSMLDKPPSKVKTKRTFFTGIHILEGKIFKMLKRNAKLCIIRDGYIPFLRQGEKISAFIQKGYWNDLGTLDRLKQTEKELRSRKIRLSYQKELDHFKRILGGTPA